MRPPGRRHVVADYDEAALLIEVELLADWYYPLVAGDPLGPEARGAFVAEWERAVAPVIGESNWVLRDFHSPNLLCVGEPDGSTGVGVIDFQDAVRGHAAYDLVSLCQDARLDVPMDVERSLCAHYQAFRASLGHHVDWDLFWARYALLGAQRNTKILGIFARLAKRDGKPQYLAHLPRIWSYLERNLAHDALAPLKHWYDRELRAHAISAGHIVTNGVGAR